MSTTENTQNTAANVGSKQRKYLQRIDGTPLIYSDKIRKEFLRLQYGENALVEFIFRGNPSISTGILKEQDMRGAVLMRETRRDVMVRQNDRDIDFKLFKVDLTKQLAITFLTENFFAVSDETKDDLIFQNSAALAERRMRARIVKKIVIDDIIKEAENAKLYTVADWKNPTPQPAQATTTAASITAIKNGQKITGRITDLFNTPTKDFDDYNAWKIVWESIKYLKKLSTEKSKEKYYPFAENGFGINNIAVIASSDLIEKLRADPRYKTGVLKNSLPNGLNEFFTLTGYMNGTPILESNQLPDNTEALILTTRAILCERQEIRNAPFAKLILGDGAHRTIGGVPAPTPQNSTLFMSESKWIHGIAFPNEMIVIRSNQ